MLERGRSTAAHRRSVLIVDDESDIRDVVKAAVHEVDPNVIVVESGDGADAFQKLGRQKFDALVLDIKMPKKDGIAVLDQLSRVDKRLRPDLILVLSAHFNPDQPPQFPKDLSQTITWVRKPSPPSDLIEFFRKALKTGGKSASTYKARVFGSTSPRNSITVRPAVAPATTPTTTPTEDRRTASAAEHIPVVLGELLATTAAKILSQKLGGETTRERTYSAHHEEPAGDISAVLPLEGDGASGSFGIAFDRSCFLALVERLTGQSAEAIQADHAAVAAEFCSRIIAESRAKLNQAGFEVRGATAKVRISDGHAMQHGCPGDRSVFRFRTDAGAFRVETIIT